MLNRIQDGSKKGENEKALLLDILSRSDITEIQHYASTSIPNLPSKPIIALMAKTDSFETVEDIASLLVDYNWYFVHPDLDQRPWQKFFVKVTNDHWLFVYLVTTILFLLLKGMTP
ncbi:GrpB family protein [Rossellomorea aquimaris]|uniref:GrpB family protein n=1 Tax=Rossellomorea aquimaris TaxID=189382 RepID=UPI003CF3C0F6